MRVWADRSVAYWALLPGVLVDLVVTCHELSPFQRALVATYGWCYAMVQLVCRKFSPAPLTDFRRRGVAKAPMSDPVLFTGDTQLKYLTYMGNIVKPIASDVLERGSGYGTENEEHMHGTMRELARHDDRICVLEDALQRVALHSMLRAELGIAPDAARSCHRQEGSDARFPSAGDVEMPLIGDTMLLVLAALTRSRFAFPHGVIETFERLCGRALRDEIAIFGGAAFIEELLPLWELRGLKATSTTQRRLVAVKGLAGEDRCAAATQLGEAP
jgi:hypothetical protein